MRLDVDVAIIVQQAPAKEEIENSDLLMWRSSEGPNPAAERKREAILLQGDLPSPTNPPEACRFHTRCPYVQPTRCRDEVPPLRAFASGHQVACHWAEQIREGKITPHAVPPVFDPGPIERPEEPPPV